MSTDVDECVRGLHTCRQDSEVCFNIAGSYMCGCKWGYTFDSVVQKCVKNEALEIALAEAKRKNMTTEKGNSGKPPDLAMTTFIQFFIL
jgi:hypothetical protein